MKLGMCGVIYKAGEEVGSYSWSFISCSYSFQIGNNIQHFWREDELAKFLQAHGYVVRTGRK